MNTSPSEQRTKDEVRHAILVDFHLATALVTARRQRLQDAIDALAMLVEDSMARLDDWPDVQEELRQLLQPTAGSLKE